MTNKELAIKYCEENKITNPDVFDGLMDFADFMDKSLCKSAMCPPLGDR